MNHKIILNILKLDETASDEDINIAKLNYLFDEKRKLLLSELSLQSMKKALLNLKWFISDEITEGEQPLIKGDIMEIISFYSAKETQFKQQWMMSNTFDAAYQALSQFILWRKEWITNYVSHVKLDTEVEGKVSFQELIETLKQEKQLQSFLLHKNNRIFVKQIEQELRIYNGADRKRSSIFRKS